MIQFIRSLLFNIVFFSYTAFICIFLLWTLLLSRYTAWRIYNMYFRTVYWLEYIILGLDYEVEGLENLPADGRYIVASKHQSAHETMILPLILHDPAIIMKKGLMQIPLWGWYAKKAGMISVDRGGRQKAIASIVKGSKVVFADNRPLIIFPQGTRTDVNDTTLTRPYKGGIAKIYDQVRCPIVPVALNSGVFWGKNKFIKKSGTITLKFLPPIAHDLDPQEMMKKLEQALEPESMKLAEQALTKIENGENKRVLADIIGILVVLIGLWSAYWLWAANAVERVMLDFQADVQEQGSPINITFEKVTTDGYPVNIKLGIEQIKIDMPTLRVDIPALTARAFPLPGYPLHIESAAPITLTPLTGANRSDFFTIDYFAMEVSEAIPSFFSTEETDDISYNLRSMTIKSGELTISAYGNVAQNTQTMQHNGEIIFMLDGYEQHIETMIEKGVTKRAPALFFLSMLKNQSAQWVDAARKAGRTDIPQISPNTIIIPFSIKNDEVYAGMFKLGRISEPRPLTSEIVQQDTAPENTEDADVFAPLFNERDLPPVQSHPRMPGEPVDIEELMKNKGQDKPKDMNEDTGDMNSHENIDPFSILEDEGDLPPRPQIPHNE